jgi:hypothetical protein
VLSLRLVIFAALLGIALWGLFSLLDNLREPELLRSAQSTLVKGCDSMESSEAQRLCPQLYCQKFLLDARSLPLRSVFRVTVDTKADGEQLIGGVVKGSIADSERRFACILRDSKVTGARLVSGAEFDALAAQPTNWSLDPPDPSVSRQ